MICRCRRQSTSCEWQVRVQSFCVLLFLRRYRQISGVAAMGLDNEVAREYRTELLHIYRALKP
jgi:hypothetical protein